MIKMLKTFQSKGEGLWSDYRGFERVRSVGEGQHKQKYKTNCLSTLKTCSMGREMISLEKAGCGQKPVY